MQKFLQVLQVIYIPIIALISFSISIMSFFGWFNAGSWIAVHGITLILLLVALALTPLSIVQFKQIALQRDIHSLQYIIQHALSHVELENIEQSLERVNPNLKKVFGDNLLLWVESLRLALQEHKIRIDLQQFRYYYKRTLLAYPRATFLATSVPAEVYLWKDAGIEDAITKFIQNGGQMSRIFFVRSGEKDLPETKEVLDRQVRMGVKVYTVTSDSVPNGLKKLFIVESQGKITWEEAFFSDVRQQVGSVIANANQRDNLEYCKIFETLLISEAEPYKIGA